MRAPRNRRLAGGTIAGVTLTLGLLLGEAESVRLPAILPPALGLLALAVSGWRRAEGAVADLLVLMALLGLGLVRGAHAGASDVHSPGGEAWIEGTVGRASGGAVVRIRQLRWLAETHLHAASSPWEFSLSGPWPRGVRLTGFVRLDPGRGPGGPGQWDSARWLRARGLAGFVRPILLVREGDWGTPRGRRLGRGIASALGGAEGAFAARFLLGKGAIDPRSTGGATDALRRAGAGHLLAVSGLHVGLVGGLLALLVGPLGRWPRARWTVLGLGLLAYGGLVGWGTSVSRAAAGGALWCLLRSCGRRSGGFGVYAAVLTCLLWGNPALWRDVGAQLSFLVSLALLGLGRGRGGSCRRAVAAVLGAQACAAPLLMAHQGWVSPWFLVSNVLLIPGAGGLMPILVAGLALAAIPGFPDDIALGPSQIAIRGFLYAAEQLGRLCEAWPISGVLPPAWGLAASAAGALTCVFLPTGRRGRLTATVGIAVACAVGGAMLRPPTLALMLDVGQGECWVWAWRGETWVFDAGPPGSGERRLLPCLRWLGRKRIDRLFLSHDDIDHTGGVAGIEASSTRVGRIHHPAGWRPSVRTREMLRRMRGRGAAIEPLVRGDTLRVPGGWALVLHPGGSAGGDGNQRALALRVEVAGHALLLCSDVPAVSQEEWISSRLPVRAGIVTAAHHGSRTSTPPCFLAEARPKALWISVGRGNRLGHPDAGLLAEATRRGIAVFRTDRDGTIELRWEGRGWRVATWATRRSMTIAAPS